MRKLLPYIAFGILILPCIQNNQVYAQVTMNNNDLNTWISTTIDDITADYRPEFVYPKVFATGTPAVYYAKVNKVAGMSGEADDWALQYKVDAGTPLKLIDAQEISLGRVYIQGDDPFIPTSYALTGAEEGKYYSFRIHQQTNQSDSSFFMNINDLRWHTPSKGIITATDLVNLNCYAYDSEWHAFQVDSVLAPADVEWVEIRIQIESDPYKLADDDYINLDNWSFFETVNELPVANAGEDQTVDEVTEVTIDGSRSRDLNQFDSLTFVWTIPAGFNIHDSLKTKPGFISTSPVVLSDTDFEFILTVSDGIVEDKDTVVISVLQVSDVRNIETSFIHIYPNPVDDILRINFKESGTKKVKIYDLTGKMYLNRDVEGVQTQIEMDNFNKGVYFVIVEHGLNKYTQKIIVR